MIALLLALVTLARAEESAGADAPSAPEAPSSPAPEPPAPASPAPEAPAPAAPAVTTATLAAAASNSPLFSGVNTPWTIGRGNGAVGLFRPLTIGLGDRAEIGTAGLVSLIAPRVEGKYTVWTGEHAALAVTGEVGVPTLGLRQVQTGFVQLIAGDQTVPWAAVAGVGVLGGWRNESLVVSGGARVRVGVPFEEHDLESQDLVWFDPLIAPIAEGWSLQPLVRVDWVPGPYWDISAQARAELVAGPELSGRLFALRGLGDHVAIGVGIAGASAREPYGWSPATLGVSVMPELDVQARW
jgi:hypothetical protein